MAFAFVASSVRIYPLRPETALRSAFEQVLEFQLTALNSDTAFDLAAAAVAAATTQTAAITTLLSRVDKLHNSFVLEAVNTIAGTGAAYILSGTAAAPVFTFDGGNTNTPTTLTFCLKFNLANSQTPVVFNA